MRWSARFEETEERLRGIKFIILRVLETELVGKTRGAGGWGSRARDRRREKPLLGFS